MDMDNLRELAGDPQFIPGVCNYCDRWCERCPLTARCLVYATEQASGDDPADHDIQSAAFWEKLGRMFEQTKQMILDDARKRGIDLGPIDVEPERRRRRRQKARAKKNELVQLGMSYLKGARDWFQANEALVEQKKRDLVHLGELAVEEAYIYPPTAEPEEAKLREG